MSADPISTLRVRKRDGSLAPYDGNEVAASIMDSARGLDDAVARATLLQAEVEITLFDGMTTDARDEAVIQVALGNAKDDPAFDTIASRIAVEIGAAVPPPVLAEATAGVRTMPAPARTASRTTRLAESRPSSHRVGALTGTP